MLARRVGAFSVLVFLSVAPLFAGTATVKLISYQNHLGAPNSMTFTLGVQPFTGSSNCSSGGGAASNVTGVGNSGYAIDVAPGNSVLLTVDPGGAQAMSDQNGYFVSWGVDPADATVGSTITWMPGDGRTICVGGFTGAHDYHARFYGGIQLLDACGNERTTAAPGETVTIRVSGGLTFNGEPHRLMAAGGSVNECTFLPEAPAYTTVHVTSDPFDYTFTLPDSDADIPAACTGSGTQHVTGNWRVVIYDSPCGCNRNQLNFTVAADAPPPAPCTIACPDDVVVANDPAACGANVAFAAPAGATCDRASGSFFPIGTTTVTCTAGALSCAFDVTVNDSEAPTVSAVTASPAALWPPNHQMVDVTLAYTGSDNCGTVACSIASVTSNEPIDGDVEIVDATHVRLRAERLGTGSGRTYTITVDCGGTTRQVTVSVPKSQKK